MCRLAAPFIEVPGVSEALKQMRIDIKPLQRDSSRIYAAAKPAITNELVDQFLTHWKNSFKTWNSSTNITENQFYFQHVYPFVAPIFHCPLFTTAVFDKQMKSLKLYPDFYAEYKLDRRRLVDIFILEIKKPNGNLSQQIDSDYVKLMREMQSVLNTLVDLNVKDPVAFGMLFDGYDCILFQMKLNGPRLYDAQVCAEFRTPRDYLDISLLEDMCEAMVYLHEEIMVLCSKIKASPSNPKQKESNWTRRLFSRAKKT